MIPFVPQVIPNILQALVFAGAFSLVFAPVLRKHPVPFYVLFIVACVLSFSSVLIFVPTLYYVDQLLASCYTGVAIYLLVMFAGALPKSWAVTKRLLSVRSELSILGGFVILFHVVKVLPMVPLAFTSAYSRIWGDALPWMFVATVVVGVPLLVCFLVPWITSFKFIRNRMEHKKWKRVQRLAYPFMALLVAQGMLLAAGHATYVGAGDARFVNYVVVAATYGVIGVTYLALKLVQRRKKKARA